MKTPQKYQPPAATDEWYEAIVQSSNGKHRVFYASGRPILGSECDGISKPNKVVGYVCYKQGEMPPDKTPPATDTKPLERCSSNPYYEAHNVWYDGRYFEGKLRADELAAEQEKSEKLGWLLLEAQKQLATEREKLEKSEIDARYNLKLYEQSVDQILATQAAIADKNAKLKEMLQHHLGCDPCHIIEEIERTVDLSALDKHDSELVAYWRGVATQEWHKGFSVAVESDKENQQRHDAEVRKPLVDALERIATDERIGSLATMRLAKDALAKVKEQK